MELNPHLYARTAFGRRCCVFIQTIQTTFCFFIKNTNMELRTTSANKSSTTELVTGADDKSWNISCQIDVTWLQLTRQNCRFSWRCVDGVSTQSTTYSR